MTRQTRSLEFAAGLSSGFIYVQGPGTDPAVERIVIERSGLQTTIVAVPDLDAAVQVAIELVEGGVQLIEVYGMFGPIWTTKVIEAALGGVTVGSASHGVES